MKQAIIDIGSNSMRVTVYEVGREEFRILFKEKVMAGLAGYVEEKRLSPEGIECACTGLLEFREILEALNIDHVAVFATASLRNIQNTAQAVSTMKAITGYDVEVISGKEEAVLGYTGAMQDVKLASGAFIDIGGASTEVVPFEKGEILDAASFPVGSLSLYKACVKHIVPGESSLKRLRKSISAEIGKQKMFADRTCSTLVCVGGTARAVLRLAKKIYALPPECHTVSKKQLNQLCLLLYQADKKAIDLILKLEPNRIHTIIPGILILQQIFRLFAADEIVVSNYGVREGYLCKRIIAPQEKN